MKLKNIKKILEKELKNNKTLFFRECFKFENNIINFSIDKYCDNENFFLNIQIGVFKKEHEFKSLNNLLDYLKNFNKYDYDKIIYY